MKKQTYIMYLAMVIILGVSLFFIAFSQGNITGIGGLVVSNDQNLPNKLMGGILVVLLIIITLYITSNILKR
ncbi:MAG: hypothetical protein KKF56_00275 [Nanoarchaeota archaeon]|nr:hypothetical protein [Nanoarchaeota archaeon]